MFDIKEKTQIVLVGEFGYDGMSYRNAHTSLKGKYEVVGGIDFSDKINNVEISGFKVYDRRSLGSYRQMLVVVNNWVEISNELMKRGYKPFRDFIPDWVLRLYVRKHLVLYLELLREAENGGYDVFEYMRFLSFERKISFFFGNTQMPYIALEMMRSAEFVNEYVLILAAPVSRLIEYADEVSSICSNVLSLTRIFIYHQIDILDMEGDFFDSDSIINALPRACLKISVPKLTFRGYFPTAYHAKPMDIIPYRDSLLDEAVLGTESYDTVQKKILTKDFIYEKVDKEWAYLKSAEESTTIKISDYIEENYQKNMLFLNPIRPTTLLNEELAQRIFRVIYGERCILASCNYKDKDNRVDCESLIHPQVYDILGLQFKQEGSRFHNKIYPNKMSLEENIYLYNKHFGLKKNTNKDYDSEIGVFLHEIKHKEVQEQNLERLVEYPDSKNDNSSRKTIPIVLCCSDMYVPISSVCIASILENSSEEYFYDIFIFYRNISDKNRHILASMIQQKNASLRLINVQTLITNIDIATSFSGMEIYFKLFTPYILRKYSGNAIYLDSDIVCNSDISELFEIDLGNSVIGAVEHLYWSSIAQMDGGSRKEYVYQVLGRRDASSCINSGMLLFNLDAFRQYMSFDMLIDVFNFYKWRCHEQDVVNTFFEDVMKYLPEQYNFTVESKKRKVMSYVKKFEPTKYDAIIRAKKSPLVIHYASGTRPWNSLDVDFSKEFWEYAKKSPYYNKLIREFNMKQEKS